MRTTEKIDFILANDFDGSATYSQIFEALGKREAMGDLEERPEVQESPEMKITSVRIHADLLAQFDVVASRFELSRNEAFGIAVGLFLESIVNNYVFGAASFEAAISNDIPSLADNLILERQAFMDSLQCDQSVKDGVESTTHDGFVNKLKEVSNATDKR